jgi:hypothetical protein
MLFLYRPRQTWMPFAGPRGQTEQGRYNRHLQDEFEATRRVPAPQPGRPLAPPPSRDVTAALTQLAALHQAGQLSDDEFAHAKAEVLGR